MIYKFKSRETGDLIMLAPDAERILKLLGKNLKEPGIITWADIPDAKSVLVAAAEAEKQQLAALNAEQDASDEANTVHTQRVVTLAQRLVPLLAMFDRCRAAEVDVIWSV